jgi:hypothetical protein
MHEQLNLFHDGGEAEATGAEKVEVSGALDAMFSVTTRLRERAQYAAVLNFLARFPQYSPLNAFLLFLQDPDASFVATAGTWSRRYGRRLRATARPLFILAPMSPVLFVFDLRDTRGDPFPEQLLDPSRSAERLKEQEYGTLVANARLHGIGLREIAPVPGLRAGSALRVDYTRRQHPALAPETWMRYVALVDRHAGPEERYAQLVLALAHVFCGHAGIDPSAWWRDRTRLGGAAADLEAESAAWLVCRRRGLTPRANALPAALSGGEFASLPPLSLTSVFQSVGYVEEMGLGKWKAPRRKSRYPAAGEA